MKILEFFLKNQKLIIFGCLTLAAGFFIDKALGVGILLVFFLSSVSLFFIEKCKDEKQRKILGALFLIVFFIHILGVFLMYYANFQPFSDGGGDYTLYDQYATQIAERVHQGDFSLQGAILDNYYPVIIGYLYSFTIPSMLIGQLFNAWLAVLSIIMVYLIARELGGKSKESFLCGLILCIYPSLAFFGSLLLKDVVVILLCLIGLLSTIKIMRDFSIPKFLGFFIVLTGLIHFRFYVGYALMFGFIISWFLISRIGLKKRIIYGIAIVFILGFSPLMLGSGYYGFSNLIKYINPEKITFYKEIVYAPPIEVVVAEPPIVQAPILPKPSDPQPSTLKPVVVQPTATDPTASQPADSGPGRGSSIALKTGLGNPVTFITNTFLSFVYAFFGPFPWQLEIKKYLFVLPEMILWYFLLFFIIKGIISSIKKRNQMIFPLIIFSIFVMGVLSIYMSNFGIIIRLRMPVFLTLSCLFPLGFEMVKSIKIPFLEKIFYE